MPDVQSNGKPDEGDGGFSEAIQRQIRSIDALLILTERRQETVRKIHPDFDTPMAIQSLVSAYMELSDSMIVVCSAYKRLIEYVRRDN